MRLTVGSLAGGILSCTLCMVPRGAAQDVRLFVDNSEGNNITVIDLRSLKPLDDIEVGQKVHGLAVRGRAPFCSPQWNLKTRCAKSTRRPTRS